MNNTEHPRFVRITFRTPEGATNTFTGLVQREGNHLRGEARHDGANGDMTLEVFVADLDDIVNVERQHPLYGSWTRWTDNPWTLMQLHQAGEP